MHQSLPERRQVRVGPLSMNLAQTNPPLTPPRRGAGKPEPLPSWEWLGRGFMVPMHAKKRKGAFQVPPVWSPGFSRSGPPEGGTPNRSDDPDGFMVPVHSKKQKGALHEPQGAAGILPAEESQKSSADETSAAPCWRHRPAPSKFMFKIRARDV